MARYQDRDNQQRSPAESREFRQHGLEDRQEHILARLPDLSEPEDEPFENDFSGGAWSKMTSHTSNWVKIGGSIAVGGILILAVWVALTGGWGNNDRDNAAWAPENPAPDAPEAPRWDAGNAAGQFSGEPATTQAQSPEGMAYDWSASHAGGNESMARPRNNDGEYQGPTKSMFGYDLPPGNSWGGQSQGDGSRTAENTNRNGMQSAPVADYVGNRYQPGSTAEGNAPSWPQNDYPQDRQHTSSYRGQPSTSEAPEPTFQYPLTNPASGYSREEQPAQAQPAPPTYWSQPQQDGQSSQSNRDNNQPAWQDYQAGASQSQSPPRYDNSPSQPRYAGFTEQPQNGVNEPSTPQYRVGMRDDSTPAYRQDGIGNRYSTPDNARYSGYDAYREDNSAAPRYSGSSIPSTGYPADPIAPPNGGANSYQGGNPGVVYPSTTQRPSRPDSSASRGHYIPAENTERDYQPQNRYPTGNSAPAWSGNPANNRQPGPTAWQQDPYSRDYPRQSQPAQSQNVSSQPATDYSYPGTSNYDGTRPGLY